MKRIFLVLIVALILVTGLTRKLTRTPRAAGPSPAATPQVAASKALPPPPESEAATLHLNHEVQGRIGIETALVEEIALAPEVRAYGRIQDPVPAVGLIYEYTAAKTTLRASEQETRRVERLYKNERNASGRQREAARAALARDRAAFESARMKLIAVLGRTLAERGDLTDRARALAAGQAAIVRMDAPAGEPLPSAPIGGRLLAFGAGNEPLEAEFLGAAPTADHLLQGRGFLFWVTGPAPPPGTAISGALLLAGPSRESAVVSPSALIRNQGQTFVYIQRAPDAFERRRVVLDRSLDDRWIVTRGVSAGDRIVVTGAQQILSAQLMPESGDEE